MATLAGMYAEAQPLMMECLDLCKKLVGESDAHTASCENNIAGLLRYQGKLAEAEPHQRRALEISEVVSGDSSKTATYLGNLAQLLQTQASTEGILEEHICIMTGQGVWGCLLAYLSSHPLSLCHVGTPC
jgi:hypothetical protein